MGRTKATALVKGVLAPILKNKLTQEVSSRPFSISADCSNHKEIKVFPVTVRFSVDGHIQNKLLSLHSLTGETAELLTETLVNAIHDDGLNFESLTAFCADNTNTNFGGVARGGIKNVFAKLKEHKSDLIGIGCFAHILHNCASSAADNLSIDFEQFCLKICSYFNGQTCRHELFKEFCEFVQVGRTRAYPLKT